MTKIGHLTDPHLLEYGWAGRRGSSRWRLGFCSFLRARDPAARRDRLTRGLFAAELAGADHVVLTGDLTEDGADAQFDVLAEALEAGPIPPRRVTIVPGNHDAYTDGAAFARALCGPLRAYAPTSTPGAMTRLRDAVVLAISTAVPQSVLRAVGAIDARQSAILEAIAGSPELSTTAVVLAQHHSPLGSPIAPLRWMDGLREHARQRVLLERHPHLHVLHGHTHRVVDRRVRSDSPHAQVFSAAAVVESDTPLRMYEASGGSVRPMEAPATPVLSVPASAVVTMRGCGPSGPRDVRPCASRAR